MEKRFEDAFKDKFEGAEIAPDETVWNNIELELARAEGGDMKRRVLFFKLMAAASVAFAMVFSGSTYFYMQQNVSDTNARLSQQDQENHNGNSSSLSVSEAEDKGLAAEETKLSGGVAHAEDGEPRLFNTMVSKSNTSSTMVTNVDIYPSHPPHHDDRTEQSLYRKRRNASTVMENTMELVPLNQLPGKVVEVSSINAAQNQNTDPLAVMMAQLAAREKELQGEDHEDDQEQTRDKLWAAVSVAAGGFSTVNPGISGSSSSSTSMAFQSVAQEQSTSSGLAYSMGVSMGTQLSSKWVLQGGVNYLTQTYDYTANAIATNDFQNFEASSFNTANQSDTKMLATSPYSVNNSMQFLSVPLQAGYLVVNKKLGVMLNAGFATDFFIKNTVTPSSSNLSKTTQGNGSESPYRSLNFSGLMGTELSYQIGKQYRLALAPGIRYPFNSIYKESTGVEASPITFDIGMKFRYLFP